MRGENRKTHGLEQLRVCATPAKGPDFVHIILEGQLTTA